MAPATPLPSIFLALNPENGEFRQLSLVAQYIDRIEEVGDGCCLIISDVMGWSYTVKEKFQVLHTLRQGFSHSHFLARVN